MIRMSNCWLREAGATRSEWIDLVKSIRNTDSINKAIEEARTYVDRALEAYKRSFHHRQNRTELENHGEIHH